MTDITELAQLRAELLSPAIGSSAHLRKIALSLVEALEKAQGMEAYWKVQCRGITDHCEELQARIAELESRTVTVKLPLPRRKTADDYVDDTFEPCDLAAVYNACRLECEVKFKNALTAAGIKVEAE